MSRKMRARILRPQKPPRKRRRCPSCGGRFVVVKAGQRECRGCELPRSTDVRLARRGWDARKLGLALDSIRCDSAQGRRAVAIGYRIASRGGFRP